MPSYYFLNNSAGPGVRANMGPDAGATTYVSGGATVLSETTSVVAGTAERQVVSVWGTIVSASAQARAMVLSGANAQVTVAASGAVLAMNSTEHAAVAIEGRNGVIDNFGTISGGVGISVLNAAAAGEQTVTSILNTGVLRGTGIGGTLPPAAILALTGIGLGQQVMNVVNTGTVAGGTNLATGGFPYAIASIGDGAVWNLNNSGRILGEVWLGAGNDTVINSGELAGRVNLGPGGDIYRVLGNGSSNEPVLGDEGNDRMYGGAFDDEFKGGLNGDTLRGFGGNDLLYGGEGNDALDGGEGDDLLDGDLGSDELGGGPGDDILLGGDKHDTLNGGRDDDLLDGGTGSDVLNGGRGDDVLTGGLGNDVFVFGRNVGLDEITDFERNRDQIDLTVYRLADFAALQATGALALTGGGVAIDFDLLGGSGMVIIYNTSLSDFDAGEFVF